MTRDDGRSKDRELAFVGKITASVSHELMNVLATIRESSGHIEDLLALDKTSFPYHEKLNRTLATIRGQVNRGMEIGNRLNLFAHSMEDQKKRLEVDSLLESLACLMQRSAGLRQVQIRIERSEPPVEIEADPFLLQMILAACIEYCLDRTAAGGTISLKCRRSGEGIAIRCTGKPISMEAEDTGAPPDRDESYNETLRELCADLSHIDDQDQAGLEFILPYNS